MVSRAAVRCITSESWLEDRNAPPPSAVTSRPRWVNDALPSCITANMRSRASSTGTPLRRSTRRALDAICATPRPGSAKVFALKSNASSIASTSKFPTLLLSISRYAVRRSCGGKPPVENRTDANLSAARVMAFAPGRKAERSRSSRDQAPACCPAAPRGSGCLREPH